MAIAFACASRSRCRDDGEDGGLAVGWSLLEYVSILDVLEDDRVDGGLGTSLAVGGTVSILEWFGGTR